MYRFYALGDFGESNENVNLVAKAMDDYSKLRGGPNVILGLVREERKASVTFLGRIGVSYSVFFAIVLGAPSLPFPLTHLTSSVDLQIKFL